jgi:hypothetical protein
MPCPRTKTSVFAVPRSIANSRPPVNRCRATTVQTSRARGSGIGLAADRACPTGARAVAACPGASHRRKTITDVCRECYGQAATHHVAVPSHGSGIGSPPTGHVQPGLVPLPHVPVPVTVAKPSRMCAESVTGRPRRTAGSGPTRGQVHVPGAAGSPRCALQGIRKVREGG